MAVLLLCCAFNLFNVAAKCQIIIDGARNIANSEAQMTTYHAPFDPNRTISAQNSTFASLHSFLPPFSFDLSLHSCLLMILVEGCF